MYNVQPGISISILIDIWHSISYC